MHAFTPDGTPLGTVFGTAWVREEEPVNESLSPAGGPLFPLKRRKATVGSLRFNRQAEEARHCPATQLINVADSEADIYEVLVEGTSDARRVDWIVRACQDRALLCDNGENTGEKLLRQYVLQQPVLFEKTIQVRGRKAKVACETRGGVNRVSRARPRLSYGPPA